MRGIERSEIIDRYLSRETRQRRFKISGFLRLFSVAILTQQLVVECSGAVAEFFQFGPTEVG